MHPMAGYYVMQARQHHRLRSAAQQRLAAEAKAARRPRPDRPPAAPGSAVWRLLLHLRSA